MSSRISPAMDWIIELSGKQHQKRFLDENDYLGEKYHLARLHYPTIMCLPIGKRLLDVQDSPELMLCTREDQLCGSVMSAWWTTQISALLQQGTDKQRQIGKSRHESRGPSVTSCPLSSFIHLLHRSRSSQTSTLQTNSSARLQCHASSIQPGKVQ